MLLHLRLLMLIALFHQTDDGTGTVTVRVRPELASAYATGDLVREKSLRLFLSVAVSDMSMLCCYAAMLLCCYAALQVDVCGVVNAGSEIMADFFFVLQDPNFESLRNLEIVTL
jgi:hypothetical protein